MKKYFEDCKTAEDVKKVYKKLARELHPDCNPGQNTTVEFQKMLEQYEQAWQRCKNVHRNAAGDTYEKENEATAAEYADLINELLHIPGIMIELCGSWLWVTGNTYPVRDQLKGLNFRFSSKKQAWYYHSDPYRKRSKTEKTMDDIRNMFGSERYATDTADPKQITA